MFPTFKQKLRHYRTYARLSPFDTSSQEGQQKERLRRIALSALASGLSQLVSYGVMLTTVPLLLRHLGEARFGIWLTIDSFVLALAFADLGLGNGLINAIGKASGQDDKKLAREYVSSAFFLLSGLGLALGLTALFLLPSVDWSRFFQIEDPNASSEVLPSLIVFATIFLLNLPLGIIEKIQLGYQENYLNGFYRALGKLLLLIGVILGVFLDAPLPILVGVLLGMPLLAVVINGSVLFGRHRPWLLPHPGLIKKDSLRELLQSGFLFFITGLAGTLAYQLDGLVIAHYLGVDTVPVYGIPLKLFVIPSVLLGFLLQPMWPAFREALVRGDHTWVKRTFQQSIRLALLVTIPPVVVLLFFAPWIVEVWVGRDLQMPFSLLLGLAVFSCMTAVTGPMAMLLNGANILGARAVASLVYGLGNLLLSIYLIKRFGVAGPVWGSVIAQLLISWPVSFYYIRQILSGQRGSSQPQ